MPLITCYLKLNFHFSDLRSLLRRTICITLIIHWSHVHVSNNKYLSKKIKRTLSPTNRFRSIIPESYIHPCVTNNDDNKWYNQRNDKAVRGIIVLPQIRAKQLVCGQTDSILNHGGDRNKQHHPDTKHPCEQEHGRQTSSYFVGVIMERVCDCEVPVYGHAYHVVGRDVQHHHRADLTEEQLAYDRVDEVELSSHLLKNRNAACNQIDH